MSLLNISGMTEKFNIRPPELMIFSNPIIFSQVFINIGKFSDNDYMPDDLVENSLLLNAMGDQYLIRESSLKIGKEFLQKSSPVFESRDILLRLFNLIINGDIQLRSRFVHTSKSKLNIPVPSHVYPTQKIKFLYHIVMTMGVVSTELDTFRSSNMLDAFREAKLFSNEDDMRCVINKILKNLILNEYCYLPISTKKLCNYIIVAKSCLE